jgi:hypothetical protein
MSEEKIEAVLETKSGGTSGRTRPRWRRWHLKSSIVLMALGAIAIIVYLLRSGLGEQYEGLGAALCVVACGGFLVWHVIHLFAEQDALEEQLIDVDRAKVSTPEPNRTDQETNPTPPPEAR